jgi:hypothetical protein
MQHQHNSKSCSPKHTACIVHHHAHAACSVDATSPTTLTAATWLPVGAPRVLRSKGVPLLAARPAVHCCAAHTLGAPPPKGSTTRSMGQPPSPSAARNESCSAYVITFHTTHQLNRTPEGRTVPGSRTAWAAKHSGRCRAAHASVLLLTHLLMYLRHLKGTASHQCGVDSAPNVDATCV